MDPRSQVLLRQPDCFTGHTLLAGLPADDLPGQLPQATGWSWHFGEYQQLVRRFGEQRCHFASEAPAGHFARAVLFLPKSRELTDYLLASLAAALEPDGQLYLVGEKRAGVERASRQLALYGPPAKLDSARHCQLWQVRVQQPPARPVLDALARPFSLELPDGPLQVRSLPGVFSHGRLDEGTALLLQHLDALPAGPLLDFGCGAGILGSVLQRRDPERQVLLLDVDAFALESSRLTLAANRLQARVLAGDSLEAAPDGLAAIISNPPFHQGVHTDYRATEQLIAQAARHLKPGGVLRIVANAFLNYPPLLEQQLGHCQLLAEARGFRIYQSQRPA